MKLGVVMDDDKGLEGYISDHFGQCKFFLVVDVDNQRKIRETKVVSNPVAHCGAVDEMLKLNVTHVIAGGMGMGPQMKFMNAGVEVFGFAGKAKDAINEFLGSGLKDLPSCQGHSHEGHSGGCHHHHH